MVDDQVDGHEGFDDARVAACPLDRAAHGGQVAEQRHAGEVLQQDAADDEGDLLGAFGRRLPGGKLPDVGLRDLFPVAVPEHGLEHDPDGDGQARDGAEARLFQRGKGMELPFFTRAGIKVLKGFEGVVGHEYILLRNAEDPGSTHLNREGARVAKET